MPAKPQKVRKGSGMPPKVPADQHPLKTQCAFCDDILPNPTTAYWHLQTQHPGEYE